MKIEVEKIKDKPISIKESISAKDWELNNSDIIFLGNVDLKCQFTRMHEEIVVDVSVSSTREIICSRCLNKVRKTINQDFKSNYNVNDLGDCLDIDEKVREEILLSFPMKVLCQSDCKGICSGCGINLNLEKCSCSGKIKKTKAEV